MSFRFTPVWTLVAVALLLGSGCTANYYRKSADREVYRILDKNRKYVEGMPSEFTIDPQAPDIIESAEPGTTVTITLQDAMRLALTSSRDYQSRKEDLYAQGLSLSIARWNFGPILSGVLAGSWDYTGDTPDERVTSVDPDTGEETEVTVSGDPDVHSVSGSASFTISKMLATGGDISINFLTSAFRFTNFADPEDNLQGFLTFTFTQPLLRGFGAKVALEGLTQSERNMIYTMRDFVRFRRSFLVGIAKDYFDILRQKDELQNTENNYRNLIELRVQSEVMAEYGQRSEVEVDQARQDELRAYAQLVRAQERYDNQLDEFKIQLGLPTELNLVLSEADLMELASRQIVTPRITEEDAVSVAMTKRLDLKTSKNRVEDAERKITVAKNALLPRLDFFAQYSLDSKEGRPLRFQTNYFETGEVSAELELPLDRKSERNDYRLSLIDLNFETRNFEERIDRIKQDVRNAVRALNQAEQSYEIQKNSVKLAERRVESTTLLLESGERSTRDVLEAREDLLDAQNALTSSIVDHYNARLDLHLAMETLRVEGNEILMKLPPLDRLASAQQDSNSAMEARAAPPDVDEALAAAPERPAGATPADDSADH